MLQTSPETLVHMLPREGYDDDSFWYLWGSLILARIAVDPEYSQARPFHVLVIIKS